MSRFSDLLLKENLTRGDRRELAKLAANLEATTRDVGQTIGPGGAVSHLRAGSVVLNQGGLTTLYNGVETVRIERDGDVFIGSNVAAAATTSFAVFSNAQTYNSESIGAGDVLLGDNTASKANVLWDYSTGQLLFRGGTTTQGYIDTDGMAYFGGGDVQLGVGGVVLQTGQAATNQIIWEDKAAADGTNYGTISTYHIGTTPDKYGVMILKAGIESGGSGTGLLLLQASSGGLVSNLQLIGSEGISYTAQSAADNNIVNMLVFERTLAGNAADGFGFRLNFVLDDDSSTKQWAGQIQTKWTDVSEAMRRQDFFFPDTNTSFLAFDMLTASTFEMVVNDNSKDMDFRVESDGNANMLFVDGGTNRVGIGTNAPSSALDVVGGISGNIATVSADSDAVDMGGATILQANTASNNVTLGGLANTVSGQLIFIYKTSGSNTLTIEHNESTGTQKFLTHNGGDIVLTSRGGAMFISAGGSYVYQVAGV